MKTNEAKLYQKIMSDRIVLAELIKAGSEIERIEIIVRQGESHSLSVPPEAVHGFLMRGHNEELSDVELEMVVENGNTIVTDGQTVITLEGVEMNKDQVWAHVDN